MCRLFDRKRSRFLTGIVNALQQEKCTLFDRKRCTLFDRKSAHSSTRNVAHFSTGKVHALRQEKYTLFERETKMKTAIKAARCHVVQSSLNIDRCTRRQNETVPDKYILLALIRRALSMYQQRQRSLRFEESCKMLVS